MLKMIGIILIMASGSGIGFRAAYNLNLRVEQLKQLKKALLLLKGEIRYSHQTMNVALKMAAKKVDEPISGILIEVSNQLEQYDGRSMSEIWMEVVKASRDNLMLSAKQVLFFEEIGNTLGYLDKEMQMNNFDLQLEQLSGEIKEEEKNSKDSIKLYRCLGVMGSILVTIILI